jgi:hypothetical protein
MSRAPYVQISSAFASDPRFLGLRNDLSALLWVAGEGYAALHLTDGHLPERAVRVLFAFGAGVDVAELVEDLLQAGIWARTPGGFVDLLYLEENPTAERARASIAAAAARRERAEAKAAGRAVQLELPQGDAVAIGSRRGRRDQNATSPLLCSLDPSGGRAPVAPSTPPVEGLDGARSPFPSSGQPADAPPGATLPADYLPAGEGSGGPIDPLPSPAPLPDGFASVGEGPSGAPRSQARQRPAGEPAEVTAAWGAWRAAYGRRYGPYVRSPGDGRAMGRLVAHAAALVEDRPPEAREAARAAVLGHWFSRYLADGGRPGFDLEAKRHPLRSLEQGVTAYGLPPTSRPPRAAPERPPERAGPAHVRIPGDLLAGLAKGAWSGPRPSLEVAS